MGHRDDLLAGAKKCLREIGYAKTTARDIVAASGTNLASIGYHFGSKDVLLTQAIIETLGEWGGQLESDEAAADKAVAERLHDHWKRLFDAIDNDRQLAIASFENAGTAMRNDNLGTIIARGQDEARDELGAFFVGTDVDDRMRRAVGSLVLAITTGIVAQRLIDRANAPSIADLSDALRYLAHQLERSGR